MLQGGSFGFIHDILVTNEHYIVLENPIKMNFGKLLSKYALGKACLAECLEYQASRPTKIHVIARPGKQSSILGMLQLIAATGQHAITSFHVTTVLLTDVCMDILILPHSHVSFLSLPLLCSLILISHLISAWRGCFNGPTGSHGGTV